MPLIIATRHLNHWLIEHTSHSPKISLIKQLARTLASEQSMQIEYCVVSKPAHAVRTRISTLSIDKSGAFAPRIGLSPGRTREFRKLGVTWLDWRHWWGVLCLRWRMESWGHSLWVIYSFSLSHWRSLWGFTWLTTAATIDRNIASKRWNVAAWFGLKNRAFPLTL